MWANILNTVIGLVVGLLTGFYFERRSSRAARTQNKQLREELESLRVSVYSVGADIPEDRAKRDPDPSLTAAVLSKARSMQNPEGRLNRSLLTAHFFAAGHRFDEVEQAISQLCHSGLAREDGKWLEIR